MANDRPICGLLVDIAGVVHVGGEPVPGAAEALEAWRSGGRPVRFATITTTKEQVRNNLAILCRPEAGPVAHRPRRCCW